MRRGLVAKMFCRSCPSWRPLLAKVLCYALALLLVAGCRAQNETELSSNAAPETIVSSTPPFQTKEPDRYQAVRITTIVRTGGETLITRSSIAKDGEMRRNETGKFAYLETPRGRFVLIPDERVYAAFTNGYGNNTNDEGLGISPEQLLHSEIGSTSYQKLGTETIKGRNSNKYRVVVNDTTSANVSLSETLIWIDEELNMPLRSETTAKDGTRITMELSGLAREVEKALFQVPESYKEISFTELRKRLADAMLP